MAKIQIIMAVTLDGFLPKQKEELMLWINKDTRYGFPHWQKEATFHICPLYGVIDLIDVAHKYDKNCIYQAIVHDEKSAEYVCGLFRYNLVNEIILYLLPLSYGKGFSLMADFHFHQWQFCSCKTFSNGICRLIYRKM